MQISDVGLDLIKTLEGFRGDAYRDLRGVVTIGYGHIGADVHIGDRIDAEQAMRLLMDDLARAQACVNTIAQGRELTQGQFDALVSLTFNIGCTAMQDSVLAHDVHLGAMQLALVEMFRWVHVNGEMSQGLLNRRMAEARRFVS
jgi:lysozyme